MVKRREIGMLVPGEQAAAGLSNMCTPPGRYEGPLC